MVARIEIYRDADLQYRWRRCSPSGYITAQGKSHRYKWRAKRAARKQFPGLPVVDRTKTRGVQKLNTWR